MSHGRGQVQGQDQGACIPKAAIAAPQSPLASAAAPENLSLARIPGTIGQNNAAGTLPTVPTVAARIRHTPSAFAGTEFIPLGLFARAFGLEGEFSRLRPEHDLACQRAGFDAIGSSQRGAMKEVSTFHEQGGNFTGLEPWRSSCLDDRPGGLESARTRGATKAHAGPISTKKPASILACRL